MKRPAEKNKHEYNITLANLDSDFTKPLIKLAFGN